MSRSNLLPAPTLNSVVPGDAFLDVSWNAVPGAIGYKVGYGTEQGSDHFADIKDTSNTTLRISPVSNGTRYSVAVKALNTGGESSWSKEQTVTPNGRVGGIANVIFAYAFFTPPTPIAHVDFIMDLTLKNTGNYPTGPFTLRLVRDIESPENVQTIYINFQSLAPRESKTESIHENGLFPSVHTWGFYICNQYLGSTGVIVE
jgi:hypothetical protein